MINYIAVPVINYVEFSNKLKGNLNEFIDELELIRKQLKEVSGCKYDNSHHRFSNIRGTEFRFQLFESLNGFNISVWDATGSISIFSEKMPNESKQQTITDIMMICNKWDMGQVRCSDCLNWMDFNENKSHKYFSGIYCPECWERKWKAVEAKENYN